MRYLSKNGLNTFLKNKNDADASEKKSAPRFKWLKRFGLFMLGAMFMNIGWQFEAHQRRETNNYYANSYMWMLSTSIEKLRNEPSSLNAGSFLYAVHSGKRIEQVLEKNPSLQSAKQVSDLVLALKATEYDSGNRTFKIVDKQWVAEGPDVSEEQIQAMLSKIKEQQLVKKVADANLRFSYADSKK